MKHFLSYIALWIFLFPIQFLPLALIHKLGNTFGKLMFHISSKFRKRVMSNLSLATELSLSDQEKKQVGIQSFQNLCITLLEYGKFRKITDISKVAICENPEKANQIYLQNKGLIFFCGHQANWEVLFLEGSSRMKGVAIGRPIKNKYLYSYIQKIREQFNGNIFSPKEGIKKGLKALKEGKFFGIVGDQGMPESSFSSKFLGRNAYTSPVPALLACKRNCPLLVATTRRENGKYIIHYSDPIYPDPNLSLEENTQTMMQQVLTLFGKSVIKDPGNWLWQHNRWKQETPKNVFYKFRYDSILIILPKSGYERILFHLSTFREIYPKAFMSVYCPEKIADKIDLENVEIISYQHLNNPIKDYRFKLVFDFSNETHLKKHFLKLSAFSVLNLKDLNKLANDHLTSSDDLSMVIKKAICRPNTLWSPHAT